MRRLALLSLLALPLSACRKQAQDEGGKVTLRFLAAPDVGKFAKEIIRRFEAENPGIKVEMVEGPAASNTREDMYASSFMAKEDTYDLAYIDVAWMPKFAANGWLRPLDDRLTPEIQAQLLPGDLLGSKFEGHFYRFPIQSDGGMLYYRKDLLAAKGIKPPETWDELVAAAKKLQDPPRLWGFVFQGKQYEGLVCAFLELVWGNGGDVIDAAGQVRLDERPAVEALERLVAAIHTDKISPEGVLTFQEEEARHSFQEGKAVFMRNWPYAWNLSQDPKSPVRGKVGIIPMVGGGKGKKGAATLGGWGYGITTFTKHPEEAWKFVEYNARLDMQRLAYEQGGILPTRKSLYADAKVLAGAPHMKDLGRILTQARPRPPVANYARISDSLQLHVSAALSLQETPEQALKTAAKEIRVALMR
jgi:multiple sugar transport system substrate-binding protein